ncbi:LPS export ABC transporter permease LptF [Thioalbus denitrificans]|uniref:LPS export ABC transporter permease LptF n=1 Tax=Thioalbus denitrificans TaxID=547122 RepID=UPI001474011A|nr:LPS export ABC transporter permease LptF [Thioalbus denitrificans]
MIIPRYIARSVLTSVAGISTLLLAVLVSNRFVNYLAEAVSGQFSGEGILVLLLLKLPAYLGQMLPLALMLAILMVFGRLYRDQEMFVFFSSGIGPGRLAGIVLGISVPVTLLVALLILVVGPWSSEREYSIKAAERATAALRMISSGRFTELAGGRGIFYVERLSEGEQRLENVFVARVLRQREGSTPRIGVISTREALLSRDADTGDYFVVMDQGHRYEGVPGQGDFRIVNFDRYAVRVQEQAATPKVKRESLGSGELWQRGGPKDIAELQWRLSIIISTPLLALLAVPLGRTRQRQGRFARILPGLFAYIVYVNLLGVARVWVEDGRIPGFVGLWWVHLLLLAAVLVLLPGRFGWDRLREQWRTA